MRLVWRGSVAVGAALALVTGAAQICASAGTLAAPGCLDGGETVGVAAIGDRLELRLDDGRTLVLPGVDPVRATADRPRAAEDARVAVTTWLVGHPVRVRPLRAEPDRWGRTVALAFASDPTRPQAADVAQPFVSVSEALLDAGLARVRPEPLTAVCLASFLAIESAARRSGTGLWADPFYTPLAATDRAGLDRHLGGLVLVEGRLDRIVAGRSRLFLRMASAGRDAFTATILSSLADRWKKAGLDPARWVGRHIRLRGTLDDRFGLQVELSAPGQVEVMDPE